MNLREVPYLSSASVGPETSGHARSNENSTDFSIVAHQAEVSFPSARTPLCLTDTECLEDCRPIARLDR